MTDDGIPPIDERERLGAQGLLARIRELETALRAAELRGVKLGLETAAKIAVRKSCSWTEYEDQQSDDYRRGVEEGVCAVARTIRALDPVAVLEQTKAKDNHGQR